MQMSEWEQAMTQQSQVSLPDSMSKCVCVCYESVFSAAAWVLF